MISMDNNSGHGTFEVDVIIERDQGIFLGLNVSHAGGGDVVDAYTTDPGEIAQFFQEVAEAKADWERLKLAQDAGQV